MTTAILTVAIIGGAVMLLPTLKRVETETHINPRMAWATNLGLAALILLYWLSDLAELPPSTSGVTGIIAAWALAATYLICGAHSLDWLRAPGRSEGSGPTIEFTDNALPMLTTTLLGCLEELFFRGYLQSGALTLADPVVALFVVNLLFSLIHLRHGLTFALSAGFFGMICSVETYLSGSLLPAIVTHSGWNLLVGVARMRQAGTSPAAFE